MLPMEKEDHPKSIHFPIGTPPIPSKCVVEGDAATDVTVQDMPTINSSPNDDIPIIVNNGLVARV